MRSKTTYLALAHARKTLFGLYGLETDKRLPPGKVAIDYAAERQQHWIDVALATHGNPSVVVLCRRCGAMVLPDKPTDILSKTGTPGHADRNRLQRPHESPLPARLAIGPGENPCNRTFGSIASAI
jgi:hypothetical protein